MEMTVEKILFMENSWLVYYLFPVEILDVVIVSAQYIVIL